MLCAKLEKKEDIKVCEIPDIENDENSVIINVLRAGICGSDINYWQKGSPKGLILGHEICAEVINPGNSDDLEKGDRVAINPIEPCNSCNACDLGNINYCPESINNAYGFNLNKQGGFSEFMKVRKDTIVKVPSILSDEEVALIQPTATCLHMAHLADIKVGDKVLILGSGYIGQICGLFSKIEGASYVVIADSNIKKAEKSIKLGTCDQVVDAKDNKMCEKYIQITEGGFDVVIDACGNSAAVNNAIKVVRPGGTIILAGISFRTVTLPSYEIIKKELNIKGSIGNTMDEFKTCIDLISQKRIDVLKFVDDVVGLDDINKAFKRLTNEKDTSIKILVNPNK